jgi:hypothetical protein
MEHCYSYTNRADEMCAQTKDMGVQATMTYADIEDLEKRVKSLDDADKFCSEGHEGRQKHPEVYWTAIQADPWWCIWYDVTHNNKM